MTSGFLRTSFLGGLAFRVLLFLSLALLPIGLIAVVQTHQIADQSQRSAELSLIAVTQQAASVERTVLQEALGAGRALAAVVNLVRHSATQCSSFLKSYREEIGQYSVVGFVRADGMMHCSSADRTYDLSQGAVYKAAMERESFTVTSLEYGTVSRTEVVVVTVPVFDAGQMIGFIFISVGQDMLKQREMADLTARPLSLIVFNNAGELVSSEQDIALARAELPKGYELRQFSGTARQVFRGQNKAGEERVYAVVPMLQDTVFAMSVWPQGTVMLETDFSGRLFELLPILMWLASLIVAFWALNRLAIKHIRKLGRQMRHFALNRTLPRMSLGDRVPMEIVAMEESFLAMANSILQDEANLENSLREKNILLKEVHHRVKNNLQLISSIMNMQIRQAQTEANRRVLQRLQDRILSLATVHKSMYQDNEMSRVNSGILLREIVSQSLKIGMAAQSDIEVIEDYDNIMISADDAAPLTLLMSETVTNALKFVSDEAGLLKEIRISLKLVEGENALLSVINTVGSAPVEGGTGLGSKLIQAFARQLNGTLQITRDKGLYRLELSFPVPSTDKIIYDY